MTNGKRNRRAGHNWELKLADIFRKLGFPYVVTTRSESRSRDNQKIDLINKDEFENGRLPYNVQAKCTVTHLPYGALLSELPKTNKVINVILHKQVEKIKDRFVPRGHYAILHMEDFLTLIKERDDRRTIGEVLVQPSER